MESKTSDWFRALVCSYLLIRIGLDPLISVGLILSPFWVSIYNPFLISFYSEISSAFAELNTYATIYACVFPSQLASYSESKFSRSGSLEEEATDR